MEKFYSAGRIPGGFFKREGRPTEKETLTSRLIDRPLRPLFPEEFRNEIQVIAQVVSLNPEVDGDIPALIGASAAMSLAGVPFKGPIGAARVGYANGQYILNPTATQLKTSDLDLVVAGTANAVLMVESEAKLLSEDVMLGAVVHGHQQMQLAIDTINAFVAEAGAKTFKWEAPAAKTALYDAVKAVVGNRFAEAFQIRDKLARRDVISALKTDVKTAIAADAEANGWTDGDIGAAFGEVEYRTLRDGVLSTKVRIDGRQLDDIRPISVRVGVLPRTHGSALFTRGETQALVVATLGTTRDSQIIDAPEGEWKDTFLFHYNFPRSRWVKPAASAARSVARSATAVSPSAACRPSSRRSKSSRTSSASSRKSPSRTAPRRWLRSAVRRWP